MKKFRRKPKKKNTKANRNSIRVRLLVIPIFLVILAISTISLISTYNTKENLLEDMDRNGKIIIEEFVKRLEDNQESLGVINHSIEQQIRMAAMSTFTHKELNNKVITRLAEDLGVDELNYYNTDGKILYSNIPDNVGLQVAEDHPMKVFLQDNKNELMENVRQSKETEDFFKYGALKDSQGNAVQIGIEARTINNLTNRFDYQKQIENIASNNGISFALFIDKNLNVIGNSTNSNVDLFISQDKRIQSAVIDGMSSASQYKHGQEEIYDVMYPAVIEGETIGAVNIAYSMEAIDAAVKQNYIIIITSGIIAIVLLSIVLFSTSNDAIKVIKKLKEQMSLMAIGDFSKDIPDDLLKKKDEFGEISQAVNTMQSSIREMIKSVLDKSQIVATHSEELTSTSQQSAAAADEVSKSIEGIASGASEQARDTEEGFSTISDLGSAIEKNAEYIQTLNDSTERVNQLKNEGSELMKELVEKTSYNSQSSKQIKEVIGSTNQSAEKIATASEMIKSIAQQTNLLALNAAIEAARAGDAGRGFAVVAEEIRKLAEQSNQFTEEISSIIYDLTDKTSTAVQTMDEVERTVDSQSESVHMTSNKFDGISHAMEEMKKVIHTINQSSGQMSHQKERIMSVIENLSAISQENAAGSEEASASVEEQTAAMTEISSASEELAKIAEELKEQLESFKI